MNPTSRSDAGSQRRPILSPHLGIYRLPLTAVLSISHRLAGVVLTLSFLSGTLLLALAALSPQAFEAMLRHPLVDALDLPVRAALGLALSVHVVHGIRHLLWDLGQGFSPRHQTALAVGELMAISLLLAAFLGFGLHYPAASP